MSFNLLLKDMAVVQTVVPPGLLYVVFLFFLFYFHHQHLSPLYLALGHIPLGSLSLVFNGSGFKYPQCINIQRAAES